METSTEDLVIIDNEMSEQVKVWAELNTMRKNNILCDMQFTGAEGHPIPAHCCVIAASSTYLRTTLSSQAMRESKFVIELPSIPSHVIDSMLTFMYTGKLCVKSSDFPDVEATASVLSIDSLVNVFKKYHSEITPSTMKQTSVMPKKDSSSPVIGTEGKDKIMTHQPTNKGDGISFVPEEGEVQFIKQPTEKDANIPAPLEQHQSYTFEEESKENPDNVTHIDGNASSTTTVVKSGDVIFVQPSEEIILEQSKTLDHTNVSTEITTEGTSEDLSNPVATISLDTTLDSTSISHISEDLETPGSTHNDVKQEIEEDSMVIDTVDGSEIVTDVVSNDNIGETTIVSNENDEVIYDMVDITPMQESIVTVEADKQDEKPVAIQVQVESVGQPTDQTKQGSTTTAYVTIPPNIQINSEGEISQMILQKLFNQPSTNENTQLPDTLTVKNESELEINLKKAAESTVNLYTCEFCGMSFADLPTLKNHLLKVKHDVKDPYICKICGNRFKYKHNLKHHMSRHVAVKPYLCLVEGCRKAFATKADLQTHNRSHTGDKPYTCEFCYKGFSQSSNLLTHKRSVHNDEFMGGARNYGCEECGKKFKTKDMLNKHMKRHAQTLTCSQCNEQFRIRKDLLRHTKDVHGISDFIPAKEDGDTVELYQCTSCEKTFLDMSKLTQHLSVVHKKAKRYSCTMKDCDYTAYFKYAVERHYIKVHVEGIHKPYKSSKERKFICHDCGAAFLGFRGLGVHMRKQHNHVGPFTYDQALHYAVKISDEERRSKATPEVPKLLVKEIEMQGKEEEMEEIAEKNEAKKNSQQEFRCEHCGDVLSSEAALKKHASLHNFSEKRDIFTCSHCSKTFFQKAHLKRHFIQFHSKETRFHCDQRGCKYECYYISQMKEHFKFKHKGKELPDVSIMQTFHMYKNSYYEGQKIIEQEHLGDSEGEAEVQVGKVWKVFSKTENSSEETNEGKEISLKGEDDKSHDLPTGFKQEVKT